MRDGALLLPLLLRRTRCCARRRVTYRHPISHCIRARRQDCGRQRGQERTLLLCGYGQAGTNLSLNPDIMRFQSVNASAALSHYAQYRPCSSKRESCVVGARRSRESPPTARARACVPARVLRCAGGRRADARPFVSAPSRAWRRVSSAPVTATLRCTTRAGAAAERSITHAAVAPACSPLHRPMRRSALAYRDTYAACVERQVAHEIGKLHRGYQRVRLLVRAPVRLVHVHRWRR
jgi:hypothetical protein